MVCRATLAPAATAADATGFALLKRYLDGREPPLPDGCVLDVELEAKELLTRFLTAGRVVVEEAYRSMRAELRRRPTPTGRLQAYYLPWTLRPADGSWFEFCRAEGTLDAGEDGVVEQFRAWLGLLETTTLNKSCKMVVLVVLLDRDALWDGMEINALAAACRLFLENHPACGRSSTGRPPPACRATPLSAWKTSPNGVRKGGPTAISPASRLSAEP